MNVINCKEKEKTYKKSNMFKKYQSYIIGFSNQKGGFEI
jgi:hypothetical protein